MKNLVDLVAIVAKEIIVQGKIEKLHKEISYIQNAIWAAYKDFLMNQDVKEYTQKMSLLTKKYQDMGDSLLKPFVENEAIVWTPVINMLAEIFRNDDEQDKKL